MKLLIAFVCFALSGCYGAVNAANDKTVDCLKAGGTPVTHMRYNPLKPLDVVCK